MNILINVELGLFGPNTLEEKSGSGLDVLLVDTGYIWEIFVFS